jgi:hypothetical protein
MGQREGASYCREKGRGLVSPLGRLAWREEREGERRGKDGGAWLGFTLFPNSKILKKSKSGCGGGSQEFIINERVMCHELGISRDKEMRF